MTQLVVASAPWTPRRLHGRPELDSEKRHLFNQWALTDEGILVAGEKTVRRTPGKPTTMQKVMDRYHKDIFAAAGRFGLTEQLIAAVLATESGGKAEAERYEKHINDYSIGLMQTLTATAKALTAGDQDLPHISTEPVPRGGSLEAWRGLLREPQNSIAFGSAYLRKQDDRLELKGDPILLYCSYNSGGVRPSSKNEWGIVSYGEALDHFSCWYGDACSVYGVCS